MVYLLETTRSSLGPLTFLRSQRHRTDILIRSVAETHSTCPASYQTMEGANKPAFVVTRTSTSAGCLSTSGSCFFLINDRQSICTSVKTFRLAAALVTARFLAFRSSDSSSFREIRRTHVTCRSASVRVLLISTSNNNRQQGSLCWNARHGLPDEPEAFDPLGFG